MTIQNKIEQISKEYISRKNIYEERKKKIEENKNDFAKKALDLTEDEYATKVFEEIGSVELMQIDINQIKTQLYYYIKLAKDLVEVPQEIQDLVSDYKPTFIYTATGEITNKEAYNQYEQQYQKNYKIQNFLIKNQEFQKIVNNDNI
jgi:hypothetical protein